MDPNHGKGPYRGPWHRLRTLEIEQFWLARTPDVSHRLRNLRALQLKNCEDLRFMMPVAQLTRLEELSLIDLPNLQSLPSGMLQLKTLKHLKIQGFQDPLSKGLSGHLNDWSGLSSLTTLVIDGFDGLTELPTSLSTLQALEMVMLSGMQDLVLPPGRQAADL